MGDLLNTQIIQKHRTEQSVRCFFVYRCLYGIIRYELLSSCPAPYESVAPARLSE